MSGPQIPSTLDGIPPKPPEAGTRRTKGAVTTLALEAAYVPATASRVAIVEDSLQVLAMLALRAARGASERS